MNLLNKFFIYTSVVIIVWCIIASVCLLLTQRVRDVQKLHDTIDDLRQEMADTNSAMKNEKVTVYKEYPAEHGDDRTSLVRSREVYSAENGRVSQSRYHDG